MFIVALSIMLIIPASMLFFSYSKASEDAVISAQINKAGQEILIRAEEVYVIGKGSWTTLDVSLPDNFENATIYSQDELVISYYTQTGLSEAVFFSDVKIFNGVDDCLVSCPIPFFPGKNKIRLTSGGANVSISHS